MNRRLDEIAAVGLGVPFRTRLRHIRTGAIKVIQMRDLPNIGNEIDIDALVRTDLTRLRKDQILRTGDLIFRSRGLTFTSVMIEKPLGNTVIAAPLVRIRPNISEVEPKYLLWCINSPVMQRYLRSRAEGSGVLAINLSELNDLQIPLLPRERQKRIARIAHLAMKERILRTRIDHISQQRTHEVLSKTVFGHRIPITKERVW
ncbi:MAG: restriction endonuclease subunit S [Ectothiorhodospiraceae bacterium AqS1]|nr:restriction endonuclease subunit S [Ectothiorhodospiraceae bacterium AqS1]